MMLLLLLMMMMRYSRLVLMDGPMNHAVLTILSHTFMCHPVRMCRSMTGIDFRGHSHDSGK